MRPAPRCLPALLLAAALAPAPSRAAAAGPASPSVQQVGKGAVVTVDLSRLPTRVERQGTATCAGSRMLATGLREEVLCQRPFAFDAPLAGEPVVLVFQPAGGEKPTRLEYPLAREPRPRTFTAPAAGTLTWLPPPPGKAGAPAALPEPLAAKARAAASESCERCGGPGEYALKDLSLKDEPPPARDVVVSVQPAP